MILLQFIMCANKYHWSWIQHVKKIPFVLPERENRPWPWLTLDLDIHLEHQPVKYANHTIHKQTTTTELGEIHNHSQATNMYIITVFFLLVYV